MDARVPSVEPNFHAPAGYVMSTRLGTWRKALEQRDIRFASVVFDRVKTCAVNGST